MCENDVDPGFPEDSHLSRRTFGGLALAVTAIGVGGVAHAAGEVVEKDVMIKTADGNADAALFYPKSGKHPAVLMWPDIMTLRPVFRDMARRLAGQGYVVLVPNFYYRSQKAPISLNFSNAADRPAFNALRAPLDDAAMDRDAKAYVAFLDAQPQTDKGRKMGVQGYCMGGPFTFRTAAVSPRIGAASTFHGGGLATAAPNSPHLLVSKTKADYLCCVAQNDDRTDPKAKETLKTTFEANKLPNIVDVYKADHGWTVRGSAVYDASEAERAWANMSSQYQRALQKA